MKKVKFFTQKENKTRLEDKAIALMILNVKCSGSYSSTANKSSSYNPNQSKKPRPVQVVKTGSYHRYFLCADLANPPHCFCIITHSLSETCKLLSHIGDEPVPGLCFYLIEPNLSTSSIGNYLSVISYNGEDLLPLRVGINIMKRPSRVVLPSSSDETYYFNLENQTISLSRARLCPIQTCTGYQCDRQREKSECTCIGGSPGIPMVYEYIIELVVNRKYRTETYASMFRSVRFTGLFFENFEKFASSVTKEDESALRTRRRSQFNRICEFINRHGGWTVSGWCKKGLLTVEGESEKVQNDDITMNLTRVYPTDLSVFDNEKLKKLLIYNDHGIPDRELTNLESDYFSSSCGSDSDSESEDEEPDDDNSGDQTSNDEAKNSGARDSDEESSKKSVEASENGESESAVGSSVDGSEDIISNGDNESGYESDRNKRKRSDFVDDEAEEDIEYSDV